MDNLRNERGGTVIVALMVTAILSLLGISALNVSDTEQRIVGNQEVASRAFFMAEAGIQQVLGVARGEGLEAAKDLVEREIGKGRYALDITLIERVGLAPARLLVRSTGIVGNASRELYAEIVEPIASQEFKPNGAVHAMGDLAIDLRNNNGNTIIDGRDHRLATADECQNRNRCDPVHIGEGVAGVYAPGGAESVRREVGDRIEGGISTEPTGENQGVPDAAWDIWFGKIKSAASPYSRHAGLGTKENPKITYMATSENLSSNQSGAGILILGPDANFKGTGQFKFEGIIIIETHPDLPAEERFQGGDDIIGAVMVFNKETTAATLRTGGQASITYSTEAIKNAKVPNLEWTSPPRLAIWNDTTFSRL